MIMYMTIRGTVCLSSFEDGQMIRALPSCKHHFHAECIDKWLTLQSSCHVCRYKVELVRPTILSLHCEPSVRFEERVGPPSAPPLKHTVSTGLAKEGTSDEMDWPKKGLQMRRYSSLPNSTERTRDRVLSKDAKNGQIFKVQ
ncbi:hypothetical protein R6Q57_024240 [Mikania cordata]